MRVMSRDMVVGLETTDASTLHEHRRLSAPVRLGRSARFFTFSTRYGIRFSSSSSHTFSQ